MDNLGFCLMFVLVCELYLCAQFTNQADLDKMVQEMAEKTYDLSRNLTYVSPFAKSASKDLSWEYQGGKPDDITIVLAAVRSVELPGS